MFVEAHFQRCQRAYHERISEITIQFLYSAVPFQLRTEAGRSVFTSLPKRDPVIYRIVDY